MALKVGIVGMGGIGNTHAGCYKKDSLSELVAVCDIVREKADAAAEKWGVKAFYSLKEMLAAHPELDIVDVTTSGYENGSWHFVPAMEAMDAGKHVLVEKPISNEITEAREMVRFAAQKKCLSRLQSESLLHGYRQKSGGIHKRRQNRRACLLPPQGRL